MFDEVEKHGLFDDFEVHGEPFWPRIQKLLGGSIIFHLIVVAGVIFIPPVRDALSIAAMFSSAGFVDRPYAKTQIADSAELLTMTTEQFRYPEGYWALDQGIEVPPLTTPTPTPLPLVQPLKSRRKFEAADALPSPSPEPTPSPISGTSGVGTNDGNHPSPAPENQTEKTDEKAALQDLKTANAAGIEMPKEGEINNRPFKDLALYVDDLKNRGQLDINQPFEIVIETELDEHGNLANPTVSKKAGDAKLIELSKRLVEAMNESGVLFYLKRLNEDNPRTKVAFTIRQETDRVLATVESDAKSQDSARILVKGFDAAIAYGIWNRKGKDEESLLRNLSVSQNGAKIIFNFTMPRPAVVDLIKKGIAAASPSPS